MDTRGFFSKHAGATLTLLDEEALLYVEGTALVHLLDRETLLIYRECDRRSPEQIATLLDPEQPDRALPGVLQALQELAGAGALQPAVEDNRRAFLQKASQLAAPLLLSSLLPQPAVAASCRCPASTFSVPVVSAATAGAVNPNLATANANAWSGTTRATFSQQICIPPNATQVTLSVGTGLDDAFSVSVNGLTDASRSRAYTGNVLWILNDTCGAPLATNVLVPLFPANLDITPIFNGLRDLLSCSHFTLNFTHCNYQGGTQMPTVTVVVS